MLPLSKPTLPKKYKPQGFIFLHEDLDLIAINKDSGILSVAALWNKDKTVHSGLNSYLQKGNPRSQKCAFVVHRLDQHTSGVMIFAKNETAQQVIKNNWALNKKTYLTLVTGHLKNKSGLVESFLEEDEDYFVHSSSDNKNGKLARTEYKVLSELRTTSLVEINLLTGKKNQIRVHMAELGNPIAGDTKYGNPKTSFKNLMLHSASLELTHPFKKERILFEAAVPDYFPKI